MTANCELSAKDFAKKQVLETVEQSKRGVTLRLATMTCRCGWERAFVLMYKCLYCGEWMCELCAERHFGKTRDQYRAEQESTTQQPSAAQGAH